MTFDRSLLFTHSNATLYVFHIPEIKNKGQMTTSFKMKLENDQWAPGAFENNQRTEIYRC